MKVKIHRIDEQALRKPALFIKRKAYVLQIKMQVAEFGDLVISEMAQAAWF
ncbi:hypothetical protein AB4Z50_26630 [Paenibacillus sp. 2TAB26]